MNGDFLQRALKEKADISALRSLRTDSAGIDFYSNDYLGIVKNSLIEKKLGDIRLPHGSTGSRLLSGNYPLIEEAENDIALFHGAEAALIMNSGYDANFGLLAAVARRGDFILYDSKCHASIRDGIRQSFADAASFLHNDLNQLEKKLKNIKISGDKNCFVITESVFSMDGDLAPLIQLAELSEHYGALLILDEAHATGVIGNKGEGLVQVLKLENRCFARIHTFGKALGCHGAVILGSTSLRSYLINFCRPFIYSTSMSPSSVAAIRAAYTIFPFMNTEREKLQNLITLFHQPQRNGSTTPIQSFVIPGNANVKKLAARLLASGYDARAILSPTVPKGEERLRITLHSFNSMTETSGLISLLGTCTGSNF